MKKKKKKDIVYKSVKEKPLEVIYEDIERYRYGLEHPLDRTTAHYNDAYKNYCIEMLKEGENEIRRRKLVELKK